MNWVKRNIDELLANTATIALYDVNGVALTAPQTSPFVADDCGCVHNSAPVSFTSSQNMTVASVRVLLPMMPYPEYAKFDFVPKKEIAAGCVYTIQAGDLKICYDCK